MPGADDVQRVALVTGAGSGIGRATSEALAAPGCHLALVDGTEVVARLQSPASGEAGLSEGQSVGVRFAEGAVQRVED